MIEEHDVLLQTMERALGAWRLVFEMVAWWADSIERQIYKYVQIV
jgi:hypothetical protein